MPRTADHHAEAGPARDADDARDDTLLRQVEREAHELADQLRGLDRRRSGQRQRFRSRRKASDQRADD